MMPSGSHRLAVGLGVLVQVVWLQCASAQTGFSWSRATIRIMADGTAPDAERIRAWRGAGIDAIVWAPDPGDAASWTDAVRVARSANVRILLGLPGSLDEASSAEMARRAQASGFDGVLTSGPVPSLSGSARSAPDEERFVVVATAPIDGAGDAPDAMMRRMPGLPDSWSDLDTLFAGRARTVQDPTVAPIAVPAGGVDERWLLLPGPVVVPRESSGSDVWSKVAGFRAAHPAVADGLHERLTDTPYSFYRGMRLGPDTLDEVMIVLGAAGKIRLNVASVFPDDVVLRDVVTGRIGLVSYGQVTFEADPSGIILLELVD